MKKLLASIFLTAILSLSSFAGNERVIYSQNFDSRTRPPGWVEWNYLENHPATWNGGSLRLGWSNPELAYGAFFTLPEKVDDIKLHFLFRTTGFPAQIFIEICDIYDEFGDEIGDLYLMPGGRLALVIGSSLTYTPAAIPKGAWVDIWFRYVNGKYATVAWSINGREPSERDWQFFIYRNDGTYRTTPARILFGPVSAEGIEFFVDDLTITAPTAPSLTGRPAKK